MSKSIRKGFSKPKAFLALLIALGVWAFTGPSDRYLRDRSVKLQRNGGACSGEQVHTASGANYILTAGHCRGLMDSEGNFEVKLESGKVINRRLIGEDPVSDLLLIEGVPGLRGLDVARVAPMGTKVRTFTHGHALDTYETRGELVQYKDIMIGLGFIGERITREYCSSMSKYEIYPLAPGADICLLHVVETVSTAPIVPGSSGGMIVDESGDLVGVVSAGDGFFGYLVPLSAIRQFLSGY